MLIYLFSAWACATVGRTAQEVVSEVGRQFAERPGIMTYQEKPDYARCVSIVASSSLREMIKPGALAIISPVAIGGAWDNAKKYIESGAHGGKKSNAHKAAVTGDTIGDPFKDIVGPSLYVLIKMLATITLVMAPLFLDN